MAFLARRDGGALPTLSLRARRGLTLIEMLVSLAVTLVMMAAVVNLFANMSGSIRNRRAGIELGGRLRQVRQQLARDLAGATCPALPWQQPGDGVGYLEIVEGRWSDKNPSVQLLPNYFDTNYGLKPGTSLVPGSQLTDFEAGDATDGRALGDYDDVLALTVRSVDAPFVGRVERWIDANSDGLIDRPGEVSTVKVESNLAEVIWYAVEQPPNDREPGFRKLYRRVLVIAPWLDFPTLNNYPGTTDPERLNSFFRYNDVSVRVQSDPNGYQLVANTLGDLTKREYRFAHVFDPAAIARNYEFPHEIDWSGIRLSQEVNPPASPDNSLSTDFPTPGSTSPLHPFGFPFESETTTNGVNVPNREGDDLALSDMLAFDIRVYDPGAPLYDYGGVTLEPTDAGWAANMPNPLPTTSNTAFSGFGAYVDLGWLYDAATNTFTYPPATLPTPSAPRPLFHVPRQPGWHPLNSGTTGPFTGFPAVYDAWSTHYEQDGVNQDQSGGRSPGAFAWQQTVVDQGTNGVEDETPAVGGVDDLRERETSPPYDTPLRSVQIILRVYERDSRQIRETSVTHSFKP